jgi:putative transposase
VGYRVSSGTVSRLNQKIYRHIEAWRNREITGEYPYVYLDGVVLKRSWAGEVRNISVLIAIDVATDGFRQILGVAEGEKEDLEGWRGFLRHPLVRRRLDPGNAGCRQLALRSIAIGALRL